MRKITKSIRISPEINELILELQEKIRFDGTDKKPSISQLVENSLLFLANEALDVQEFHCDCKEHVEH